MAGLEQHLVIVEAYDGLREFLTDEPASRAATRGLGLPAPAIAEALGCRITLLTWDDWLNYEQTPASFLGWRGPPETRPLRAPGPAPSPPFAALGDIRIEPVPARDPDHGLPFRDAGCSARVRGLLADSDPLFTLSFCLERHLMAVRQRERLDAVLLPMWGGLGFVAQLARATGCSPLADVRFGVVVTGTSASRQRANGEGLWTRPSVTRRQMEDMSLALADLVLVFGERGARLVRLGRPSGATEPIRAVRFIASGVLDQLSDVAERAQPREAAELFLHGPKQGAAGTLATLDGLALLRTRGLRLPRPLACSGPEMVFAPMLPRDFAGYWSTRGFVRELLEAGQWAWAAAPPRSHETLPVRLYPSCFEHLPSVWFELARGSAVALSEAAAEGLIGPEVLPRLARIDGTPDAWDVAAALEAIAAADPKLLDKERRRLCRAVVAQHRGPLHARRFADMISGLKALLGRDPGTPELGVVARLLLDRTRPAAAAPAAVPAHESAADASPDLTVVVIGYEMGDWLRETIESVWASRRLPDEVLLIDDGSAGRPTLRAIEDLETAARQGRLPLRVLRQPNAGLARARNAGLAAARGRFISFLDGDDLIAPDFYGHALDLLEREPRLGGVAAWAETFGEGVAPGFWNAPQPELPLLLVENTVFVPCMVRTALLRELGGYDPEQRYNYEDWELSIRLVASGHPIITIPRYLHRYRVRSDSLFRTMTAAQNQTMRELLLEKHRATLQRFPVEVSMLLEGRMMKVVHADRPNPVERLRLLPVRLAQRTVRRLAARSARR